MADAAHAIGGEELDQRLPVPETDDELEELGEAFNSLLDRLQESFERQRRFTGDASHQLRTPLTALQGQVDLALRQDRDTDEYKRVLTLVQRKTRHLRQIVESLLFLARADGEALQPGLETIELTAWLREQSRSWLDSSRGGDLHWEAGQDGPLWARVPPALLPELLNNLLDNAIRYSAREPPSGSGSDATAGRSASPSKIKGSGFPKRTSPAFSNPSFVPRRRGDGDPWDSGWACRSRSVS